MVDDHTIVKRFEERPRSLLAVDALEDNLKLILINGGRNVLRCFF